MLTKRRPRAAFVVTLSALSLSVGLGGCKKDALNGGGDSECKPPDCHMNPPPQPTPQPTPSATPTPPTPPPTTTLHANPPPPPRDGGR